MAPILRDLIQTSYFRVVVVEDVDSVECCGALKVIYKIFLFHIYIVLV